MATRTKKIVYKVDDSDLRSVRTEIGKTGRATSDLEKKTEEYQRELKQTAKTGQQSFLTLKNAISIVSFAAIIAGLKQLGSRVIEIGAQFQKLEAVLTNTLGSRSKAQAALNDIKLFAAQTPFAVAELSGAFVKLANQGFVPTRNEMRKLGDIAASTGKEFNMLAEAIIDAQVGEFERLKEFGIRAQKEGDKVSFTFKGVKEQVDFTEKSIQNYILSLGDAAGVTGAMESISRTLGGQISNLGDSFDALFLAISESTGAGSDAIWWINQMTQDLTSLISVPYSQKLIEQREELHSLVGALIDNNDNEEVRSGLITEINQKYPEFLKNIDAEKVTTDELRSALDDLNKQLERKILLTLQEEANELPIKNLIALRREEIKEIQLARGEDESRAKLAEKNLIFIRQEIDKQKSTIAENNALYRGLITNLGEVKEEEEKITESVKKQTEYKKSLKELEQEYLDLLKEQEKIQAFRESEEFRKWADTIKSEWIPAMKNVDDVVNETMEETNNAADEAAKSQEEAAERMYDAWKKAYDDREELERAAAVAGIDIINMLLQSQIEARQVDFDDFNQRKEEELAAAGDNANARAAIEKKFAKEEIELKKKQAEFEKKATLKRILIENALGVAKAIAAAPPPINVPLIAIQVALGAAQYIAAASIPAYKDGVIDLAGPGTGTSDSIPARLSRGESVMTAVSTKRSKQMLKDIQDGKIDDRTYKMMMSGVPAQQNGTLFDDSRIVSELQKNRPPEYDMIGSILYEYRTKGETSKQKIRKKFIN